MCPDCTSNNFPGGQSSLFSFSFTASTATIVRNPSRGSSGCLNCVTWSATPHYVAFFPQFCVWFMVSPASFQVGCRSYIPFVVYFAHNNVNGVWAWTGDVLLDGLAVSTVPRRYKDSGFFWMATRVALLFARKKAWNVSLWNSRLVHLCDVFFFFCQPRWWFLGERSLY